MNRFSNSVNQFGPLLEKALNSEILLVTSLFIPIFRDFAVWSVPLLFLYIKTRVSQVEGQLLTRHPFVIQTDHNLHSYSPFGMMYVI